jgi:hypothetical protein
LIARVVLGLALFGLAGAAGAAPDGFGSRDGRIKARTPIERSGAQSKGAVREAVTRKPGPAAVDPRRAVIVGDLDRAKGTSAPPGSDLKAAIAEAFVEAESIRPLFRSACADQACLEQAAATAETRAVVLLVFGADQVLTVTLAELPGRGVLRTVVSAPLEAGDRFDRAVVDGLRAVLQIGTPQEGALEVEAVAEVAGETEQELAQRERLTDLARKGLWAGAGAAGLGVTLGLVATINHSQWRNSTFRHGVEHRDTVRGAAYGRAVAADVLMVTGALVAGASYVVQRRYRHTKPFSAAPVIEAAETDGEEAAVIEAAEAQADRAAPTETP